VRGEKDECIGWGQQSALYIYFCVKSQKYISWGTVCPSFCEWRYEGWMVCLVVYLYVLGSLSENFLLVWCTERIWSSHLSVCESKHEGRMACLPVCVRIYAVRIVCLPVSVMVRLTVCVWTDARNGLPACLCIGLPTCLCNTVVCLPVCVIVSLPVCNSLPTCLCNGLPSCLCNSLHTCLCNSLPSCL
jgi:hypothetical protein